jgi:hypothetical protein
MHSPGISEGIDEAHERNLEQSTVGIPVEIRTGHLSDSDQERCHLSQVSVVTVTLK